MKFPSLFKTPSHQRFNYMPRYYDEVKEDIENRTRRIRRELEMEGVLKSEANTEDKEEYQSQITGAFSKRAYYKSSKNKAAFTQFLIFIALVALFGGYIMFGNDVFFGALLVLPAYLYFRLKKRS